nr:unnamed protein product [Naegleria fowleri]
MSKNGWSTFGTSSSASSFSSSSSSVMTTLPSSSLPRLTQVISIHNVKEFVKNYLIQDDTINNHHHHHSEGNTDMSILFRHVYCLFRETLYYSQPQNQQQTQTQSSSGVNISSSSTLQASSSSGGMMNQNNNNNNNNSSSLSSFPKGFLMMYEDGSQVICLFFELDTKRLASEAQVLISTPSDSNMMMMNGSPLNDFVYVMVRITSFKASSHSRRRVVVGTVPSSSTTTAPLNTTCSIPPSQQQPLNHTSSSSQKPSSFVAFEDHPIGAAHNQTTDHNTSSLLQQLQTDPSEVLFRHQAFNCSEVNLKTFCEEYVKVTNHKAAVANIIATFGSIEKSIRSSEHLQVEVFKNCTCRSFSGDHFTVAKDILGLCKIALFDKTARKGLQKEQLDYYAALKQDKPFYTLLKRMEKLTQEIIMPMFSLLNYCHRSANVSLSHMLFKFHIRFRVLSVEPITLKQPQQGLQRIRSNSSSISTGTSSYALNMANQRNSFSISSTSTAGFTSHQSYNESYSLNKALNEEFIEVASNRENETTTNVQPSLIPLTSMTTTSTVYEPDIKTEQRMICLPRGPFVYKPLPLEPHTRKSAIEKDIFCMGILFLTYVTGYKEVGEIPISKVEEMLKQLRVCVDYLRQAQVQFEELINTKKCGDATKIYLLCERYSHITALLYSLSTLEKLISEMVECKTCAFKDMLYLTDSTKIEDLIDTLRDKTFKEKTNSCNIPRSPALGNLIRQEQEKKKLLSERSRTILSNIPNSLFPASSPDSPTLLSTSNLVSNSTNNTNSQVTNNKRKRDAMMISTTPTHSTALNQQEQKQQGVRGSNAVSSSHNLLHKFSKVIKTNTIKIEGKENERAGKTSIEMQ